MSDLALKASCKLMVCPWVENRNDRWIQVGEEQPGRGGSLSPRPPAPAPGSGPLRLSPGFSLPREAGPGARTRWARPGSALLPPASGVPCFFPPGRRALPCWVPEGPPARPALGRGCCPACRGPGVPALNVRPRRSRRPFFSPSQDEMEFGYTEAPHKAFPVVFDSPRKQRPEGPPFIRGYW